MSALRKVLVVDDDPVVGKSFNRVLSQEKGYVVITAQNAAEALEKLREQEYDVIFTDIKMPGMDGIELAERVKAKRPWTPVVIVTGYGSTANEARARTVGVSAFVNKPLSPEMIEESARNALREPVLISAAQPQARLVEKADQELGVKENKLKHLALALAAPLIGLIYVAFLPFVGLAMLAWMGGGAFMESPVRTKTVDFLRNVGMFIAAPFVGLVYALLLPFVGTAVLAWVGVQALMAKSPEE